MFEFDPTLERTFKKELDDEYIRELGSLGLYDASLDNPPNPSDAPQRWAENPCIFPSED